MTSIHAYSRRFAGVGIWPRPSRALLAAPVLSLLLTLGSASAWADDQSASTAQEIKELKARLAALEKRLNTQSQENIETRKMVAVPTKKGEEVAAVCPVGKFCYKGLTITPGGFFALEGLYRQHNMESDIDTPYGSIPFPNNPVGNIGEGRLSERQSRLSLMVQGNPNPATTLTGYGEFDFLGAAQTANFNQSNSFTPRVRQLYAGIDETDWGFHMIAGQSWSLATLNTFSMDPTKTFVPTTIDAQYVVGYTWTRQPQLRMYENFGNVTAGVSLENASTIFGGKLPPGVVATSLNGCGGGTPLNPSGDQLINACNTYALNDVPDLIGKVAWDGNIADHKVHIEGFGIGRAFDDRTIVGSSYGGADNYTWGGGGGGGIVAELVPHYVDLDLSGLVGNGVGRYGTSTLPDVTYNNLTGKLVTVPNYQIMGGVTVHATPYLDIYGYAGDETAGSKYNAGAASSGYGYGNPLGANNTGCEVTDSLNFTPAETCNGNTKAVQEITVGFWDTVYKGDFGQLKWGAQYEFIQRELFAADTPAASGSPRAEENVVMTSLRYYPF
jgi:hypothetical protein